MSLLDEDDRYRINVFDWSGKDGFLEIMKAGGFDAVIGNPPIARGCHRQSLARTARTDGDLYVYFSNGHNLLREWNFGVISESVKRIWRGCDRYLARESSEF
jgi:hypothetical protein